MATKKETKKRIYCLHCYMDFDSRKHACAKYDETFVNPHRWACDDWERDL